MTLPTRPLPDPGDAMEPDSAPPIPGAEPASPRHDEWLLDEALDETFPASDPISPATPRRPAG
jgi:hypothetical protein